MLQIRRTYKDPSSRNLHTSDINFPTNLPKISANFPHFPCKASDIDICVGEFLWKNSGGFPLGKFKKSTISCSEHPKIFLSTSPIFGTSKYFCPITFLDCIEHKKMWFFCFILQFGVFGLHRFLRFLFVKSWEFGVNSLVFL